MKRQTLTSVNPVKLDKRPGRRDQEYDFDKVFIDEWDGECGISEVTVMQPDSECWYWEYEGKPGIFIEEDAIYVDKDNIGAEAHNQAYFALSYLDGLGLVKGWRKL